MDIIEKVVLLAILFLAIYSMYCFLPLDSKVARFLGGLFYCLNPFVYDRLMAGHWQLLLAYALTPFVLRVFSNVFKKPDKRTILYAALAWSGVAAIDAHYIIILGLLFIALTAALAVTRKALFAAIVTIVYCLILSSWWLIPLALVSNVTQGFGAADIQTFVARPDTLYGIWLTLLSLQGFWFRGWQPLDHFIQLWPWLLIGWLTPACVGLGAIIARQRNERRMIMGLSLAAGVSVFFVAGPSIGFGDATTWILLHVPGLRGMREPQKLVGLVALLYAVLTGYGVAVLIQLRRRILGTAGVLAFTACIVAFGWPLLWGAQGQLKLSYYPDSWEKLNVQLHQDSSATRVLVLPYELYVNKTFAGRLVANPAQVYFGQRAITSNDPKLPGVSVYESQGQASIAHAIASHDKEALQKELVHEHIQYLIFITSDDINEYAWIKQLPHTFFASDAKSTILQLTTR